MRCASFTPCDVRLVKRKSNSLKSNGLADADIAALQTAIDQDKALVDPAKKQFGPSVRTWMSKMLGKVIDSSWQIELGVAGGLLAEALKTYYFS